MYGNKLDGITKNGGSYNITIGTEPMYAVVESGKPVISHTEFDEYTLVSARFPDKEIGDSVIVTAYDENGNLEDTRTVVLDGKKSCVIKFPFDNKVNHTVKFEAVRVSYSYEVQGSKTMKTDVEVNNSTGDMSVSARYLGGRQGDAVSLEVTDANGKALYYDQMYLDENLECSTEFKVDPSVRYIVTLGTEGLKKAHIVQKDVGQIMFTVKKGSNVINRFDRDGIRRIK